MSGSPRRLISVFGSGSGFFEEIADAIGTVFDGFAKSLYGIFGVIEGLGHLGGLLVSEEIESLRIEVGGRLFLSLLLERGDLVFQFGKAGIDGDLFLLGWRGLETGDLFPQDIGSVLGVVVAA